MTFSLFMLEHTDATNYKRYMSYDWNMKHGGVNFAQYNSVYTGEIEPHKTVGETLEAIYALFNHDSPADYYGRSMCVSDVIVLEETGSYFCDTCGFVPLDSSKPCSHELI